MARGTYALMNLIISPRHTQNGAASILSRSATAKRKLKAQLPLY
jgi:hypothetical protein